MSADNPSWPENENTDPAESDLAQLVDAVEQVGGKPAADKKVAGLLEKESAAISDAQNKINNVELKTKAATRENGKRSSEVLKKDRDASKLKSRKYEDSSKQTICNLNQTISDLNQTLRNLNDEKKKDAAAAAKIQKEMLKKIESLQKRLNSYDIDKVSREVNETRDEPVSTCTILGYYCFALCSDNVVTPTSCYRMISA